MGYAIHPDDLSYDPDILLPVTEILLHWEGMDRGCWCFSASGTRPSGDPIIIDSDSYLHKDLYCPLPQILAEAYKRLEQDLAPPPIATLLDASVWKRLTEGVGWAWVSPAHGLPWERAEA